MSESFDEFQPAPNEWDEFQPANPGPSTRDVLKAVSSIDPAQASKASKLAKKYNAADEVLLRTLQDAEMVDRINTATTKLDKAPVLADYMRNSPFVAAQAQKDIDPLVKMNEQMRAPRTALGTLGDVGVTALKGVVGLPQSLVGLVDIPTLGGFGKDLETLGVRFKDTQNFLSSLYSPAQQQANQAVSEADGFVGTLGAMLQNPSTIATTVGQSAPQMLGGAAIGRGLVAVAPRVAPWLSAALGEGIISAGGAAEQTREQTDDGRLSVKQSLSAVASGGGTALFGAVGGKVSQRLGLADIDTALVARGVDKTSAQAAKTGFIAAVTKAGVSEGVFEELPQSVQEQMWQNYANDRPINDGVGAAAAQGLLAGLSMGSGFQVLAEGGQRIAARAQQADAAAQDAAKLQNLMASAAEATLRQNNPETFAQLVQHMADNTEGAPKSVYIDAQVFNQAVQTFTPEQLAQAFPSVTPEQIAEAVTTNRTVEVPIGEALAAVPGTPLEQVFLQNARSAPNALSLADAQTQGEQAAEWIKTEAERVLQQAQDQAAWQTSSDAVRTTILDQLNQAGRFTPEVNEAYATLQMHFFSTMAALTGVTPQEMYDRFALKVAAGSQQATAGNLEQTLYRGAGGNTGGRIVWATTDRGLAEGYAAQRDGGVVTEIEFNAEAPFDAGRDSNEMTPAQFANRALAQAAKRQNKPDGAAALAARDAFLSAWPDAASRNVTEFWRNDAAKGPTADFLKALGFDSVMLAEADAQTVGVLNQSPQSLPPTIEVDGKQRATTNSNGQPIAATEEGVRNFWAWFGDSKVVDAAGRPLVLYHGTTADVEQFDVDFSGADGVGYNVPAIFATTDKALASDYALNKFDREIADAIREMQRFKNTNPGVYNDDYERRFRAVKDAFAKQRADGRPELGGGANVVPLYMRGDMGEVDAKGQRFMAVMPKALPEFMAQGKDGVIVNDVIDNASPATDYPARVFVTFAPENVKSAIGNSGEFDPANPNILMQSEDQSRLMAVHNLSADNLIFADKMGGLAVPSIGVVNETRGAVDGFGEITLIGRKDMVDPKQERVFSADAYTVRFPKPEWPKAKAKDAQAMVDFVRAAAKEFDDGGLTGETWDNMVNSPDAAKVVETWVRSSSVKALFLREKGVDVQPVMRPVRTTSGLTVDQVEALRPLYEQVSKQHDEGQYGSPEEAELKQRVEDGLRETYAELGKRDVVVDKMVEKATQRVVDTLYRDVRAIQTGPTVDTWDTSKKISEQIEPYAVEFKQWVESKIIPKFGDPFIKVGSKKAPYTLDNIVKTMTDTKVKGKEKTMTYGAGQVRAAASVEFSDLEQMRAAASTSIVDPAQYEAAKAETEKKLENYRSAVVGFTKATDWRGNPDTWEAMDASMRALAKWATGKKRDAASMKAALRAEDFDTARIPDSVIAQAMDAADALLRAPVPYFEAKPQRAVNLDEFAGAVIPADAPQAVRDILAKHNIPVTEAAPGVDRTSTVREFAAQLAGQGQDTLFQQARGTFNPQSLLITLNENANLSTFLHESGHFFLEVMAELASQPNAPAQVRENMDKLLKWFGIRGDENVGGPDAGGSLAQFAGKKAKGADLVALESAQQRIAGGEDAEQVRRATGWFQGADGKWRFEISDDRAHFVKTPKLKEYLTKKFTKGEKLSKADKAALDAARAEFETANDAMFAITDRKSPEFDAAFEKRAQVQAKVYALEKRARGDFTKLGDILVHDTLFAAYPDLKDVGISLSVDPTMENTAEGAFDTRQNRVVLSAKTEQALLENLFHEIQHAIQTREGYARGGSPESDGGLAGYRRLAGEVEARNTAARSGLTPEQRRETAPGATSDTPANEVTVVFAQDGNLPTDNTQPVRRTPLETWRAMTLDQKRPYHERFAESFEAYLLEGKAPSAELQPLFRRFRSWLVNVYKSLKEFMRGRDLNMNDEVRQVFDRMLATDEQIRQAEEAAGMLPDFDATNEAIEKLQARSLRDLKWTVGARSRALKALQKEAANLRKAVEAEVRAEVDDMPVYQAQAAIDRIKGEPSTEQLETIAEATGFTSASEMLTAIGKDDTKAAMIEGMTDQRMLENFGELATPQAIEEAANDAVHNEARARALATELKGQADALNPRQQTGTDRNGRPVTVNALVAAAKQFAENITARRKVKDLKKAAAQHRAAEARAGKAWQEATAKGKTQEAVQAKRDQLLNNYAAKSMQEADAEITKVIDYFKKFDKDTIRKNIPSSYLDQIDALLENMDLRKSVSRTELERRASLRKWVESQQAIGLDPIVPDELMENAQRISYKEMTVDELRSMRDVIKNIEHLGRLKSKLLAAKDKREFDAAVDAWAKEIRDNGGKPLPVKLEGDSRPVKMFKSAWADHRKLNSLIRQFAANADNSEGFKLLIRSMNERGTQEDVMIEKASVRLAEIHAPIEKLPGGFSGAKLFIPEINNSLTRAGRLAVALNWGNEQNRQRVRDGDNWTNEQVDAILRTLTPVELKFVNDVWEYLDSYWPEIKAKQERVSGVVEDKVQADPFTVTLADGTEVQMRGGYYPIKYDGDRSLKSQKQEAEQIAKDMLRGAMLRPATRRGHTKARVDEVIGRPVKKDLSVITQHVTQVVHDLAWHEWAIDANRLMNDPRIASAIRDYYGAETHRAMTDAIEAIVVGDVAKQTSIDQLLLMMRANVTRSIMGASLTTALLQPFGLTQSMARIGVTPVLKGAGRWAGDALRMESTVKWVGEKSDFMRLRSKTFNRELREISQRVRGKSKIAQVADASLFMLMQKMQLVADIPTWVGAYEKALNSGAEEATAVQLADEAVLSSQGGGNTRDLAAVQRDHPFLTQFYSYFNTTLQLVTESTAATDFKNPRAVAGWLGDMMLLAVVPAILPALITFSLKGGGEDDEPEEWAKRLVEWQAGYMLGMFVGLRELPALWSPFDYGGPPAAKLINDGRRLVQQANQGEIDEPAVLATIGFLGTALGIPTTQIVRSYKGWKAWDEGDAPASSILFGPPPKD